jgi:hypothetical protein
MDRWNGIGSTADILRYSTCLDKVKKVPSFTTAIDGGLALLATDGKSIYYFVGFHTPTPVHKFNIETNLTVRLPMVLPSLINLAGGVSTNGTMFIFNGARNHVLEFNPESETGEVIGELPFQNGTSTVYSITAITNGQDGVWLFAGNYPNATNPVLFFNSRNKIVQNPLTDTIPLPTLYAATASVSDGRKVFLIVGMGSLPEHDGTHYPTNGVLT